MGKFPIYKQLDRMDCGPACLRMIAKYYGKEYSLQTLREKCHITREGVSLLGISDAAEFMGLRTKGVMLTWDQLSNETLLPCIIHWKGNHFVVVYSVKKKRSPSEILVADPAVGLISYGVAEFKAAWLQERERGVALLIETGSEFYQKKGEDYAKLDFRGLLAYLRPYKRHIAGLLFTMLVASGISMVLPFITQAIVDRGVGNKDVPFVILLLIAQMVLVLGQVCNNMIRSWLMLHTTTKVSISIISDFFGKLMRLPISFFDSKMIGDLLQRIGDFNRVQSFLTGSLLSIMVAVVSLVVYGIVMAGYDLGVFVLFFIGSVAYICWVLLFLKKRRKLDHQRFQESAASQGNIVQMITGMQDIKLNGCEEKRRGEWEMIQDRLFKVNINSLRLGQIQEVGGTFIEQSKNILITFLSAKAVIEGDMTLGMMMALQYIIGQLNAPISQFISFVRETQNASISLERLDEVYKMKDEEPEGEEKRTEIPQGTDIVFNKVSFQYEGPHSAKVLDKVSLRIKSGSITAIVGASGSGKTTMLKMMLGFYKPTEGEILLGNRPLKEYSESYWRRNCGSVMQEGYIFSDTIAGNIGISDNQVDINEVRKAARIANIEGWIEGLPLEYDTKVGIDGHGLSMGQKQRLLIARVAYKDSKYLFLDEATNSLDANNEREIMENLSGLFKGKTVVIVAHRLSTVRDADKIVVLDRGRVVEEGTHQELISLKGKYYKLVRNQLE